MSEAKADVPNEAFVKAQIERRQESGLLFLAAAFFFGVCTLAIHVFTDKPWYVSFAMTMLMLLAGGYINVAEMLAFARILPTGGTRGAN